MKKVMFVLVALLLVSTYCFALESGPSNKVGYVKLNCLAGNTAFGLPFKFWAVPAGNVPTYGTESTQSLGHRRRPDELRHDLHGGPGLSDGGNFAYRNSASSCGWAGTLETVGGYGPGQGVLLQQQNRRDPHSGAGRRSGYDCGRYPFGAHPAPRPYRVVPTPLPIRGGIRAMWRGTS